VDLAGLGHIHPGLVASVLPGVTEVAIGALVNEVVGHDTPRDRREAVLPVVLGDDRVDVFGGWVDGPPRDALAVLRDDDAQDRESTIDTRDRNGDYIWRH
jgi:hypothetical protein